MDKKYKIVLIVAALVLAAILVARWLTGKSSAKSGSESDSGGNNSGGGGSNGNASATFPLHKGSRGQEVRQLQRWLNSNVMGLIYDTPDGMIYVSRHNSVSVDSIFGDKTEAALKAATGMTEVSKDYFMKTYMNSL